MQIKREYGKNRTEIIQIRLSPEERKELESYVCEEEISFAIFFRGLMVERKNNRKLKLYSEAIRRHKKVLRGFTDLIKEYA